MCVDENDAVPHEHRDEPGEEVMPPIRAVRVVEKKVEHDQDRHNDVNDVRFRDQSECVRIMRDIWRRQDGVGNDPGHDRAQGRQSFEPSPRLNSAEESSESGPQEDDSDEHIRVRGEVQPPNWLNKHP